MKLVVAKYRVGIAFVAGLIVSFLCYYFSLVSLKDSLAGLQRTAFVIGAFIVAVFNLRFKLFDAILGERFTSGEMIRKKDDFITVRTRLEHYIVFFLISAVCMSMAPLIGDTGVLSVAVSSIGWGSLCGCAAAYIWILQRFRELEDGMYNRVIEHKSLEERQLLDETDE